VVPAVVVNDSVKSFYFLSNYLGNGNLVFNHFSISAYRLLKQSKRDINSKFGQEIFLNVYNTPYGGNYIGSQFSFYGVLFFPGLAKHHHCGVTGVIKVRRLICYLMLIKSKRPF